ncbi:hypothetical protein PAMP_020379 [Pampus punctatissimus]
MECPDNIATNFRYFIHCTFDTLATDKVTNRQTFKKSVIQSAHNVLGCLQSSPNKQLYEPRQSAALSNPRIKTALVKDSDGNVITTEANCLEHWKEHFSLHLRHNTTPADPTILAANATVPNGACSTLSRLWKSEPL